MTGFQPIGDVTERDFDYDTYRLMQEIKRSDALARARNGGSMDGATMALHKVAMDLLKCMDANPGQMDMADTQQKLRRYTALLATERMLSFGQSIEVDGPENGIVRIHNPDKEDPGESFDLKLRDLKFT